MALYRHKDGREQTVDAGSDLEQGFLDPDAGWTRVDQPTRDRPSDGASLGRMSRKELDAVAINAGVENPKRYKSKSGLLKAIRDHQGG